MGGVSGDPLMSSNDPDWVPDPWDNPQRVIDDELVDLAPVGNRWHGVIKIVAATTVSLVVLAGVAGFWLLRQLNPGNIAEVPVNFTVNEGDSVASIAARLEKEGIIVNDRVFRWYVGRNGGLEVLPGYYALKPRDNAGNVMKVLGTPPAQTFIKVTFPEGFTVDQVAERLAEQAPYISRESVVEASRGGTIASVFAPVGTTSLEGLLFPDTYQVAGDDNASSVLSRMVALMERVGRQEGLDVSKEKIGRGPYDVLIIASMIEREAKVEKDRALISRVIYNRLAAKMKLEIDATLYYGADPGAAFSDLKNADSAYNTYKRAGLPPTPIANPGRASLQAALSPAPNPLPSDPICQDLPRNTPCEYRYYVLADDDGSHVFAATYEQHLVNVEKARAAGLLG